MSRELRPDYSPAWATAAAIGAGVEVPSAGKILAGFVDREEPPFEWVNYLFRFNGEWTVFFDHLMEGVEFGAIEGFVPSEGSTPGLFDISAGSGFLLTGQRVAMNAALTDFNAASPPSANAGPNYRWDMICFELDSTSLDPSFTYVEDIASLPPTFNINDYDVRCYVCVEVAVTYTIKDMVFRTGNLMNTVFNLGVGDGLSVDSYFSPYELQDLLGVINQQGGGIVRLRGYQHPTFIPFNVFVPSGVCLDLGGSIIGPGDSKSGQTGDMFSISGFTGSYFNFYGGDNEVTISPALADIQRAGIGSLLVVSSGLNAGSYIVVEIKSATVFYVANMDGSTPVLAYSLSDTATVLVRNASVINGTVKPDGLQSVASSVTGIFQIAYTQNCKLVDLDIDKPNTTPILINMLRVTGDNPGLVFDNVSELVDGGFSYSIRSAASSDNSGWIVDNCLFWGETLLSSVAGHCYFNAKINPLSRFVLPTNTAVGALTTIEHALYSITTGTGQVILSGASDGVLFNDLEVDEPTPIHGAIGAYLAVVAERAGKFRVESAVRLEAVLALTCNISAWVAINGTTTYHMDSIEANVGAGEFVTLRGSITLDLASTDDVSITVQNNSSQDVSVSENSGAYRYSYISVVGVR